jgi:hypothetical protein
MRVFVSKHQAGLGRRKEEEGGGGGGKGGKGGGGGEGGEEGGGRGRERKEGTFVPAAAAHCCFAGKHPAAQKSPEIAL